MFWATRVSCQYLPFPTPRVSLKLQPYRPLHERSNAADEALSGSLFTFITIYAPVLSNGRRETLQGNHIHFYLHTRGRDESNGSGAPPGPQHGSVRRISCTGNATSSQYITCQAPPSQTSTPTISHHCSTSIFTPFCLLATKSLSLKISPARILPICVFSMS